MKKIILLALTALILSGCLNLKKPDETKTSGTPEVTIPSPSAITNDSLEQIEAEANSLEMEDFDQDLNTLDQDINQL